MDEKSILRLAMIMEDQSATTVDKYICKLVECVLFYSEKRRLSAIELCEQIAIQYQLEFDYLEIENAILKKSRGRIILTERQYELSPKTIDQLSQQTSLQELLEQYIQQFLSETEKKYEADILLTKIQEYLYYCFNSSKENLLSLLNVQPGNTPSSFVASNDEIQQINDFVLWDNLEKNKLLYDIISFSYEYCMLTTKKDTLLSRRIFRGKKFYLDANIIFRMAGINKDERKFVTESFIKKCNEVGIELYYTSETLDELFRVIDGQISYISSITQGQQPVDSAVLQSIDRTNEINDFYVVFYNWCKEPQNKFNDFSSFQRYLWKRIRNIIDSLKFAQTPKCFYGSNNALFNQMCDSLEAFKKEKRPNKNTSKASLQTDINNLLYISSLRSSSSTTNLWETNEYFVSADQLLTNWSKSAHSGVPIVVIPSTWLSIILRFAGRSENDYKAYCLFMSLRQHRNDDDSVNFNPVSLLKSLAIRTSDQNIKMLIIEEIINNGSSYPVSSENDYPGIIQDAFDEILRKSNDNLRKEMLSQIDHANESCALQIEDLKKQLNNQSKIEETAIRIANNRADRKIEFWAKFGALQHFIPFITLLLFISIILLYYLKINPIYQYFKSILSSINERGFKLNETVFLSVISLFLSGIPTALFSPLKYLSSNERRARLVKKYKKETLRDMD